MCTAAEVLKGAIAAVLGFPIGRSTTNVKLSEGNKGRLAVRTGSDKEPQGEKMLQALTLANDIVRRDVPCRLFAMSRADAEAAYGSAMYDSFEAPSHVTELSLVYIEGVNFHASPNRFLTSTGSVGRIAITKTTFRATKQELEVCFDV
ncbi:unnamed protein product, partial [Phaeothamnion confervicola]